MVGGRRRERVGVMDGGVAGDLLLNATDEMGGSIARGHEDGDLYGWTDFSCSFPGLKLRRDIISPSIGRLSKLQSVKFVSNQIPILIRMKDVCNNLGTQLERLFSSPWDLPQRVCTAAELRFYFESILDTNGKKNYVKHDTTDVHLSGALLSFKCMHPALWERTVRNPPSTKPRGCVIRKFQLPFCP